MHSTIVKKEVAPKDKVFQTAARLFYQHGYRAIGVDTLAEESGIGKMTLYRHYPSKDDLIVAYLKDSNEIFWRNFEEITKDAPTPRAKLLAFFESLQDYTNTPACYGCPFLNVATEYPETDYPGHQVAIEHKQSVRVRFRQLAKEAGAKKPEVLADQLFLLMDGAYMASRMFGTKNPASHLASAAKILIDAQIPK
jgi:AcrR family transcriptional regulator